MTRSVNVPPMSMPSEVVSVMSASFEDRYALLASGSAAFGIVATGVAAVGIIMCPCEVGWPLAPCEFLERDTGGSQAERRVGRQFRGSFVHQGGQRLPILHQPVQH